MTIENRPLGPCNLLTLREAVRELGIRHAVAVNWMETRGLIHQVAGRRRVIAGDLADAIREDAGKPVEKPAKKAKLPRVLL